MSYNNQHLREPLNNLNCIYCLKAFSETVLPSKEHVIGRKFVPKGTLANEPAIIAQACQDCNNKKSRLEGIISAYTFQPDALGNYSMPSPEMEDEAKRKGSKWYCSMTSRPIWLSTAFKRFEFAGKSRPDSLYLAIGQAIKKTIGKSLQTINTI